MTNIGITKKDVTRIATVLREGSFDSADDAAKAVLAEAFEIYEGKAKFVVAGQLFYAPKVGFLQPEDERALKVCFGPYPTPATARGALESLAFSTATGEEFRRWVLPIQHGTPAAWHRERKKAREDAEVANRQSKGMTDEEEAKAPIGIGLQKEAA